MNRAAIAGGAFVFAALASAGCSLFIARAQPVPGAERNVRCDLEYRPDPDHQGPDILFIALANPYQWEEGYMNPLEPLVHMGFGPGRHLSTPVEIRGAVCDSPWRKGHRLPMMVSSGNYLLCRRQDSAEVEITVQTKWGSCEMVIPEGDREPRCRQWGSSRSDGLRFMSQAVCGGDEHERTANRL